METLAIRETHDVLAHITAATDRGDILGAHARLNALEADPRPEAQALRGRIIRLLGGGLRAFAIQRQLFHAYPQQPLAQVHYLRYLTDRKGIYRAWQWSSGVDMAGATHAGYRAEWHAHLGGIAAALRDWKGVASHFDQAYALTPDDPWIWVCHAYCLIAEDRYDAAVTAAHRSLELRSDYRSAVQLQAHLHSLKGHNDEAIDILRHHSDRMRCGEVEMQLAGLLMEQRRYEEAEQALDRCRRYYPLADKAHRTQLEQQRVACLLAQGRFDAARESCHALGDPFHSAMVERIDAWAGDPAPHRVLLDVPYVRQHHLTCAPATLSALSRYWRHEAEHLEIAEEICYDGTPTYSERAWAERNGFLVREFTVDLHVSKRLIDAGVPFTLTTQATHSGHLQALIGYDAIRGTILLRDPFLQTYTEYEAASYFADQKASGPRGMLMLPPDQAARLDGIALPDAAHWDSFYLVMRALSVHDRQAAEEAASAQQARAPEHWLTLWALRALAYYDGDQPAKIALADRLIERFGATPALLLQKEHTLTVTGTRRESIEAIEAGVRLHPHNPQLLIRLAQLQASDARQIPHALDNLYLALRLQPTESGAWRVLADMQWRTDKALSLQHYRIAACVNEFAEDLALAYCRACCSVGQVALGLQFLNERVSRLGHRSSNPARTYFSALEMMSRMSEAYAVLDMALQQHPDDDALRLFCAEKFLLYNKPDQARATLAELRGAARQVDRLRVEAALAQSEGRLDEAWSAIQSACEQEPLQPQLSQTAAQIIAQRDGQAAAIAYLRHCCEQHPTCISLYEVLLQWMAAEPAQEKEAVQRRVLALNPDNAFMWRELAISLSAQQRLDEAWRAAYKAQELAPEQENGFAVLAGLHFAARDVEAGQAMCREALLRSIDQTYCVNQLVGTCNSLASRRMALEFIRDQLHRQVTQGNTVLAFQVLAKNTLTDDELEAELRALNRHRPELWQTWIALALQLSAVRNFVEARAVLTEGIAQFPLVPRLHYELARVDANEQRYDAARDSVRLALQLSPAWDWALRLYVELALVEPGHEEDALALLDSPLSRSDALPECYVLRSRVLWQLKRRDAALQPLMQALRRWPGYQAAWDMLTNLAGQMGRQDLLSSLAVELTEQHPGNAESWIRLADRRTELPEALAAVAQALKLEPLNQRAYIARIHALMRHRDFDGARKQVEVTPWGRHTPVAIQRLGPHLTWQQGDREKAIAQMQGLLKAEPKNFDLWKDLADWLSSKGDHHGYAHAASEMVRINPSLPVAHGYVGDAQLKLGRHELAMESLGLAWKLDVNYSYAAFALVDLQLEHDRIHAGSNVLALRERFPGAASALRFIRYVVEAQYDVDLTGAFDDVVRAQPSDANLFNTAVARLKTTAQKRLLRAAVERACLQAEASEIALRWWIGDTIDLSDGTWWDTLRPYLDVDRHNRLKSALIWCATSEKKSYCVANIVERYDAALRADPQAWGMVSYGYTTCGQHREAVEWMTDWQREDAPSWALDNLALAMRTLAMNTEARAVSQASHRKAPNQPNAMVWLAADAALAGEHDTLRLLLERVHTMQIADYYASMRSLLEAYLQSVQSGSGDPLKRALSIRRLAAKSHKPLRMLMDALKQKWIGNARGWRRTVRWFSMI